jgi:hypothetical protein
MRSEPRDPSEKVAEGRMRVPILDTPFTTSIKELLRDPARKTGGIAMIPAAFVFEDSLRGHLTRMIVFSPSTTLNPGLEPGSGKGSIL